MSSSVKGPISEPFSLRNVDHEDAQVKVIARSLHLNGDWRSGSDYRPITPNLKGKG